MKIQVNVLEAKNRLSELLRAANDGDEVIIANRGRPVARLVPAGVELASSGHPKGSWAAIKAVLDKPRPGISYQTPDEIEACIKEMRDDWDGSISTLVL